MYNKNTREQDLKTASVKGLVSRGFTVFFMQIMFNFSKTNNRFPTFKEETVQRILRKAESEVRVQVCPNT